MHLTLSSRYGAALVGVGAVGVGVVLLVAGCGSGTPAASTTPPPSTSHPPATTTSPTPSPSPSPSSTPSASASATPKVTKAADGRKLSACQDLRCEVEVKGGDTIRFAAKYDIKAFHVQRVAKQTLYFATADGDGGMHGYVGGSGSVSTADVHIEMTPLGSKRMILKIRPR
ncbi:hypothetical protein [Nonomuraea sp. NPDC050202]|uniref:hypothetical protein n=1 Tax=Nonomuraea sp. NPDC050202 TaxID=3155035 RepID=UPI0033C7FAF9